MLSTERPYSGSYNARLGGENNSTDAIEQIVTVPANGTLSYYWFPSGQNDMADTLRMEVTTVNGSNIRLWVSLNATNGRWYKRTVSLGAFAGRSVRIRFSASTNAGAPTTFYVDDISLK